MSLNQILIVVQFGILLYTHTHTPSINKAQQMPADENQEVG